MGFIRHPALRIHGAAILGLGLVAFFLVTGCTPAPAVPTTSSQIPNPTDTATPYTVPVPEPEQLDLREANVLSVEFEPLDEGRFRFSVTLLHDDDGEAPDFADWWQVEDTQGNLLGRRVLTHGHGTQAFTRSEIITIPATVMVVIVRGHDMQHGYGGQSMHIDMQSGLATAFNEGE